MSLPGFLWTHPSCNKVSKCQTALRQSIVSSFSKWKMIARSLTLVRTCSWSRQFVRKCCTIRPELSIRSRTQNCTSLSKDQRKGLIPSHMEVKVTIQTTYPEGVAPSYFKSPLRQIDTLHKVAWNYQFLYCKVVNWLLQRNFYPKFQFGRK